MNHAIIQTEGLRFAYAEEGAVNPFVLDGVSLDIEEAPSWLCWGTTAPASPPWPST